jgi:hypothetical protein
MTGLLNRRREGPIGPSPSDSRRGGSPDVTAFRSDPAQNVPPSPQNTAAKASESASKARNASDKGLRPWFDPRRCEPRADSE